MKKKYRDIEEEINAAIEDWDCSKMMEFLRDVILLIELYDVDKNDDWLENKVGGDEDNVRTIRLVRSMYIVSKIAEFHTSALVSFRNKYPRLHERMEKNNEK